MNPKHELELKEKNVKKLLIGKDDAIVRSGQYPGHPWSIVKLVLLGQWAYVYTAILKTWHGGIRYVDLLAGTGTTRIQETGDIVKGSAFAVKEFAYKPFNEYILVESDKERYNALEQNAKLLGNATLLRGDCNHFVEQIFENKSSHNLVFVDMEGWDVTWDSMTKIIDSQSDIIINFPTSCYERTKALESQRVLDLFFGDHTWAEKANDREDCLRLYKEKLADAFIHYREKPAYVEAIRVGKSQYFYDMILMCKQGGYTNVWGGYMKERWDMDNPKHTKRLLDHLKGRELRLDAFTCDNTRAVSK
jgi:three-Cys-motif partner protein